MRGLVLGGLRAPWVESLALECDGVEAPQRLARRFHSETQKQYHPPWGEQSVALVGPEA